jgi:hypothetical protein
MITERTTGSLPEGPINKRAEEMDYISNKYIDEAHKLSINNGY